MTQRTGIGDAGTLRSWQPTQVDINRLRGLNADPAIDGLDVAGAGDDGAQFQLGYLRQVLDHPGDPQQHVRSAERSADLAPLSPSSRGAARTERIRSSASASVSGASLTAQSADASPAAPSAANSTSGPTTCSCSMLIATSAPPVTTGWTMTPASRLPKISRSKPNRAGPDPGRAVRSARRGRRWCAAGQARPPRARPGRRTVPPPRSLPGRWRRRYCRPAARRSSRAVPRSAHGAASRPGMAGRESRRPVPGPVLAQAIQVGYVSGRIARQVP